MVLKLVSKEHNLKIDLAKELGGGGYGKVFIGKYKEEEVAVKRVQVVDVKDSREEEALQNLSNENVVKYHHYFVKKDFGYIILELCASDLDTFCKGKYSGPSIPSDVEVLIQLTKGLNYIHSNNFVHRDIKPQNILISKTSPVVMKWADFGFTKPTNIRGSCSMSGLMGTSNWLAPEILRLGENEKGHGSKQSDIFSTGCVFFYFLTRGTHLFGRVHLDVNANISEDKPINTNVLPEDNFAKAFIIKMIAHKSEERIALAEILNILDSTENTIQQSPAVEHLGDSIPPPAQSSPTSNRLDERPQIKNKINKSNNKKENVIPIADLFLEKRKKPRWAIKARVIKKSTIKDLNAVKPDVPPRKNFFVILEDGSEKNIKARACTAALCKKFYKKFQVGKEYIIKNADFDKSGREPILSLRRKAEVILQ